MKTLTELRKLVVALDGQLEQDPGGRFEVWQCVAPYGRVWKGGSKHIRLEWMPGESTSRAAKAKAIAEAAEIVRLGHREMTEQERFECNEPALPPAPRPDFSVYGCGTIALFIPLTDAANAWLDEHCPADGEHQYMGHNLCVEPRYLGDLCQNAVNDGLQSA